MIQLTLQNHAVWQDLTELLESLDSSSLAKEHLEECDYQVRGYWDEQDRYYEAVILPKNLSAELVSSSIGITHQERFLKLKFVLMVTADSAEPQTSSQKIGELLLVYNENLEFIDENWLLEIESPLLKVTPS